MHEPKPVAPNSTAPRGKKAKARTGSILIVEDDPGVRDALTTLLTKQGHAVMAAADGEQATAIVADKKFRPDIVVADYNLPRAMTGVQVMMRLHTILGADLPALILSGDIATETLNEIAREGYVHRSKPVKADDLARIVQRFLARKKKTADAPA